MDDAIERFKLGLLIVFLFQILPAAFLDRAQLTNRIYYLTGSRSAFLPIGSGRAFRSAFFPVWAFWLVSSFVSDFSGRHPAHTEFHWAMWQKIAIGALYAALFLFLAADFRSEMRFRALGEFRLSRGKLFQAVGKLSKNSRYFGLQDAPLFVIPDAKFIAMAARASRGVVLPLGLLDQLSRVEVDALALRQLCLQSRRFYFPTMWILLCCNVIVAAGALWLRLTAPVTCVLCLCFMAIELTVLGLHLPRMCFEADLRAIRLCDNPEDLFLAAGGFSRLTGVPLDGQKLSKLGEAASIPPQRISELLAAQVGETEDRYPTSGSYMDTGL